MRGRSLHLLASPARFKLTGSECHRLNKSRIVGLLSNRNSAAVFILSRNESTGPNSLDGATQSGENGYNYFVVLILSPWNKNANVQI